MHQVSSTCSSCACLLALTTRSLVFIDLPGVVQYLWSMPVDMLDILFVNCTEFQETDIDVFTKLGELASMQGGVRILSASLHASDQELNALC